MAAPPGELQIRDRSEVDAFRRELPAVASAILRATAYAAPPMPAPDQLPRSAPQDRPQPGPLDRPFCPNRTLIIDARDAPTVFPCAIFLGPYESIYFDRPLKHELPTGYMPTRTTKREMLEVLYPEMLGRIATVPIALGDVSHPGVARGMFFDGDRITLDLPASMRPDDYFVGATRLAQQLIHAFAEEACALPDIASSCNMTPKKLREHVAENRLLLDTDGTLDKDLNVWDARIILNRRTGAFIPQRSQRRGGTVGYNYAWNRIGASSFSLVHARAADYLFWWAHRLFGWQAEGRSSDARFTALMADLCGRLAWAHVLEIARLVLHELLHEGRSAHCWDLLGGANCCQDVGSFAFREIVRAIGGFPTEQVQDGFVTTAPEELEVYRKSWNSMVRTRATDGCNKRSGTLEMEFEHCRYLQSNHPLRITWTISDPLCIPHSSVATTETVTLGSETCFEPSS